MTPELRAFIEGNGPLGPEALHDFTSRCQRRRVPRHPGVARFAAHPRYLPSVPALASSCPFALR